MKWTPEPSSPNHGGGRREWRGPASSPVFLIIIQYVRHCSEQQQEWSLRSRVIVVVSSGKRIRRTKKIVISIISLVWILTTVIVVIVILKVLAWLPQAASPRCPSLYILLPLSSFLFLPPPLYHLSLLRTSNSLPHNHYQINSQCLVSRLVTLSPVTLSSREFLSSIYYFFFLLLCFPFFLPNNSLTIS